MHRTPPPKSVKRGYKGGYKRRDKVPAGSFVTPQKVQSGNFITPEKKDFHLGDNSNVDSPAATTDSSGHATVGPAAPPPPAARKSSTTWRTDGVQFPSLKDILSPIAETDTAKLNRNAGQTPHHPNINFIAQDDEEDSDTPVQNPKAPPTTPYNPTPHYYMSLPYPITGFGNPMMGNPPHGAYTPMTTPPPGIMHGGGYPNPNAPPFQLPAYPPPAFPPPPEMQWDRRSRVINRLELSINHKREELRNMDMAYHQLQMEIAEDEEMLAEMRKFGSGVHHSHGHGGQ